MDWTNKYLNKVICGDCRQFLPTIPNNSIDLILTDPPYNIDKKYAEYNDNQKESEYWSFITSIFKELYRVLKDRHHLVFTCAQKQIWIYRPMLEDMGFSFRHLAVWHNPKRKAGSYPGMWPFSYEPILDFTKGGFKRLNNFNGIGYMDVWIESSPSEIKHPAARPVQCWANLIKLCSDEGDIVLDPFMGSGTTALVAKNNKRNFIGFEISSKYCEIAESRLQQRSLAFN